MPTASPPFLLALIPRNQQCVYIDYRNQFQDAATSAAAGGPGGFAAGASRRGGGAAGRAVGGRSKARGGRARGGAAAAGAAAAAAGDGAGGGAGKWSTLGGGAKLYTDLSGRTHQGKAAYMAYRKDTGVAAPARKSGKGSGKGKGGARWRRGR